MSQVISSNTGQESIDRHETHAGFDQAAREQTTLTEAVHAILLAHCHWSLDKSKALRALRLVIKR